MEKSNERGCGGRSMMDDFDDNILTEILIRVPMKMKFRCKAVCKRWFHLISDPSFARLVLGTLSTSTPWFFLYQYQTVNRQWPIDDDLRLRVASENRTDRFNARFCDSKARRVYAAHNGLILCCCSVKLYVGNPLTGKWVTLPRSQIGRLERVGFIVSCNNGNTIFKVVRVIRDCLNFEVFSSDVGEWKDTGVAVPATNEFVYYRNFRGFNSVVHDGKLHWIAGNVIETVMVYDPDKNECRVFSFNVPLSIGFNKGLIGASCGHLCFASYAENREQYVLSVCVLENYEAAEWRPLMMTQMRIVLEENEINEDDGWNAMMPLAFHPFDKDIVYFNMWNGREGKIVSLNLGTKKLISLTGEDIPLEGHIVEWPTSVYEVPPWPTSVPQNIWKTTSVPDDELFEGLADLFS